MRGPGHLRRGLHLTHGEFVALHGVLELRRVFCDAFRGAGDLGTAEDVRDAVVRDASRQRCQQLLIHFRRGIERPHGVELAVLDGARDESVERQHPQRVPSDAGQHGRHDLRGLAKFRLRLGLRFVIQAVGADDQIGDLFQVPGERGALPRVGDALLQQTRIWHGDVTGFSIAAAAGQRRAERRARTVLPELVVDHRPEEPRALHLLRLIAQRCHGGRISFTGCRGVLRASVYRRSDHPVHDEPPLQASCPVCRTRSSMDAANLVSRSNVRAHSVAALPVQSRFLAAAIAVLDCSSALEVSRCREPMRSRLDPTAVRQGQSAPAIDAIAFPHIGNAPLKIVQVFMVP